MDDKHYVGVIFPCSLLGALFICVSHSAVVALHNGRLPGNDTAQDCRFSAAQLRFTDTSGRLKLALSP